ncbi:MAG TPA: ABC transporter permease [Alphaproteobacteria bacterium]|nr:ABC transporter permease [Alphaproteobacteria bacterium]
MRISFHHRAVLAVALLIAPVVVTIAVFMLAPLGLMGVVSFLEKGINGGVRWGSYTVEPYVRFLFERDLDDSLILNSDYLQIFWRSIWLSLVTTVLALAIGFPTALYMALQPQHRRNLLVFLVTLPFWTNLLVRNYSWILLLRTNGLINDLLIWLGLVDGPLILMPSSFAIGVGLTYSFLPFMVLPIYASLEKLDFRLVEAAYDLGANRWAALKRVIIPLSLPGIVAGSVLVFIPCLGAFVTPELLGGGKSLMIGNLIQNQFGASRNWPFGAALALTLLAMVLLTMMVYLTRLKPQSGRR